MRLLENGTAWIRSHWRCAEFFLDSIESVFWRFLYSCWTLCHVALTFLALWLGVVVNREHMAGLFARFNRISIVMQLVESATMWCAGSQWTFPVQLFISVLPRGLNLLLGDRTVPPSQSASPDMVEKTTAKSMTMDVSQLPVVSLTAALYAWLFKKRYL